MNIVKELREKAGMQQKELAILIGVKQPTVSEWEHGKKDPSGERLRKIAELFQVEIGTVLGYESQLIPLKRKAVPILGDIACGDPITAEENMDGHADLPDGIRADFALRCKGSSMEPTFADGDLVLIRQQEEVPDGKIAAVLIGSEATLKRVHRIPDGVMLIPDNSQDFSPLIYQREEAAEVRIIGLAVGYVRLI